MNIYRRGHDFSSTHWNEDGGSCGKSFATEADTPSRDAQGVPMRVGLTIMTKSPSLLNGGESGASGPLYS